MSYSLDLDTQNHTVPNLNVDFIEADQDAFNLNHKLPALVNNTTFPVIDSLSCSY